MAEALAVIGFVSSVAQLIHYGGKVIKRLNDFDDTIKGLPDSFSKIRVQLPLLLNVVDHVQAQAERGDLTAKTKMLLLPVLEGLRKEIEDFDTTLLKILPSPHASQREKISKAIRSVGFEKRLREFRSNIQDYLDTLSALQGVRQSDSLGNILELLKGPNKASSNSLDSHDGKKPVWMVKYDLEEDFVGRDDIMAAIDSQLREKNRRVSLAGIGGVGKSRIAIQYCYRYRQENPGAHVFWVHGGSRSRFGDDYRKIARLVDLPGRADPEADILRLVAEWLSDESNGPWLMILDNADDRDIWLGSGQWNRKSDVSYIPLIDYLPRCFLGRLLVTTRDRQLGHRLGEGKAQPLDVSRLGPREAQELLYAKLRAGEKLDPLDASDLTRSLEYLPLTITQAAAYLEQTGISASEYLELFRAGQSDIPNLLEESIDDPIRDREGSNSVFHTWRLSFQQIEKQSPKAAEMLSLMAVLDRQAISRGLLRVLNHNELEHKAAISKLKAFSLVQEEDHSARYTLHRLVQLSTRGWLSDHGKLSLWQQHALEAVAQEYPTSVTFEEWPVIQDLSSHVSVVLAYEVRECQEVLNRARILHTLGHYTMEQGLPRPALVMFQESHRLREKYLGKEEELTLETLGLLGLAHSRLNEIKQCHDILIEFHGSAARVLGPRHRLTLKGMSRLAVTYEKQGRSKEGKELLLRALSLTEETFGATSEDAIRILTNLAYCYNRLGHWRDAEDVALRALKLRIEHKGKDHPDTMTIMGSLAWTFRAQSRFQEAEQLESKALMRRLEVLGVDHPKTQRTMANMAELLGLLDRWQDAEILQRQVVEVKRRVEGTHHWATKRAETYLDMLRQLLHNKIHSEAVKSYLRNNSSKKSRANNRRSKAKTTTERNQSNSWSHHGSSSSINPEGHEGDTVNVGEDMHGSAYADLRNKRQVLQDIEAQLANFREDQDQYNALRSRSPMTMPSVRNDPIRQLEERLVDAKTSYWLAAKALGIASPKNPAFGEGRSSGTGASPQLPHTMNELGDRASQFPDVSERPQIVGRRVSIDSMATLVEPESSVMLDY